MKLRRDDLVMVLWGKDKGKKGKVHRLFPEEGKALVSGVNRVKRHLKPRSKARQAGIVDKELPVPLAKVALVCAKCNRPTKVGYRFLPEGTKARYCKACGELI